MRASKQFVSDFAELAKIYGWDEQEQEEMKICIRQAQAEMVPHITKLAADWRRAEGRA